MADADLEARLESHSTAFESLMSLIPADLYYGKDNSDQWQRKKQTKEQRRAAKMAKLDPAAYKSALDVQNERKRKREEEASEAVDADVDDSTTKPPAMSPMELVKKQKANDGAVVRGSKPVGDGPVSAEEQARRLTIADKRKEQRNRKKQRDAKEREKREQRKEAKQKAKEAQPEAGGVDEPSETAHSKPTNGTPKSKIAKQKTKDVKSKKPEQKSSRKQEQKKPAVVKEDEMADDSEDEDAMEINEEELLKLNNMDPGKLDAAGDEEDVEENEDAASIAEDEAEDVEMNDEVSQAEDEDEEHDTAGNADDLAPVDFQGLADESSDAVSDTSLSNDETPTFDHSHQTSISSASSIQPDSTGAFSKNEDTTPTSTAPTTKSSKLPQIDPVVLQERLQAKLTALRAARNADGVDGKPAKNRQELIDARRRKEESRKAHKKELRAKARQEERDAESEAKRLRGGSGSPLLSPGVFSPVGEEYGFSFGRVNFEDGTAMDPNLSTVLPARKKKGPQDPKTALDAVNKKKARIAGLDAEKRADIEEKDRWLNAKKRIHGERIRDDTSLLKKTLKRKEKVKEKGEREWTERIEGVTKGKEMKQKKREDNLRKRREEKGGSKGKSKGKPAMKKRPGFEGSFKSGGGKKP